ncbi:MAG: lysophospholipid acyltransferase family protein [Minwuiales bacterium]|nr:lysophospholipid acyltransferase family protein [Minwuiales bacterium]
MLTLQDVRNVSLLSMLAVFAWLLPERAWPRVARLLATVEVGLFGSRPGRHIDRLRRVLGDKFPRDSARQIEVARTAGYHEDAMQIFASYRPWRWQPSIELCGRENLDAALQGGNGAILWVGNFSSSSLVTKMAFGRAGVPVSHLSRPAHGFSRTRFGIRFLNPIRTRVEDRYLGARVSMPDDTSVAPFRTLRKRLRANGVVSITVGQWARKTVSTPFFGGTIRLATGPANLAQAAKAPLLPVFTVRNGSGVFEVHIGAPVNVAAANDRDDAFAATARRYVQALEPYVLDYPGQWRGWPRLVLEDPM